MDLRASATEAEDVAASFRLFRAPLPEHEAEITDLIADLYTISSSLRRLDALSKDRALERNWRVVQRDVVLLQATLKYTVEDICRFFHRLNGGAVPPAKYREAWRTIELFFWEESKTSLRMRLARFRTFLGELGDVMQNKTPDFPLMDAHRDGLKTLVAIQERQRVTDRFGRISLGRNPPSTGSGSGNSTAPSSPISDRRPRRGSFERTRPSNFNSPQSPLSPASGGFDIPIPPLAPEAPSSPLTGSASATTNTSQSVRSDVIQNHWIKDAFNVFSTKTQVPFYSEVVGCFGKPTPGIKEDLIEDGFERLLRLDFNDGSDMVIYFYLRETDNRTRIIIRVRHEYGNEYYCLPLNMLEIIRSGSSLQLCRRRNSGKELHAWAALAFETIESMVEFFCVFLALRSQDTAKPVTSIRDYELEGEEQVYGGQILDDGRRHALRVYREKKTKSIRFQSSVLKGERDRAPVWTAFVTQNIGRRGWLQRLDPRTILVRDLKPQVLLPAEEYTLPQVASGEHVLRFRTDDDAESFLESLEELAESKPTRGVRYV